jgi:hypothetical protein
MRVADNGQSAIDEGFWLKVRSHAGGPIDPSLCDVYHEKALSKAPPETVDKLRHGKEAGVRGPEKHGTAAIQMKPGREAERAVCGTAHGDLPCGIDLGQEGAIWRLGTEATSPER